MIEITLNINKKDVYGEVAKTTSYVGSKMDDETAYERISTTDENEEMLDRYWEESKNLVCNSLKKQLLAEQESDDVFSISLGLSNSFDENLVSSMNSSLFSFFVMNITAKWYTITNKSESSDYASEAATYMEDVVRKVYFKKRPVRPTY